MQQAPYQPHQTDYVSPPYPDPYSGPTPGPMDTGGFPPDNVKVANQNPYFLQWLFNFKREVTVPLRNLWRGYEQNDLGAWQQSKYNFRVMNEQGITWAISYIESFINPVFVVSNYSQRDLNWTMRMVGRVVYNNLCARYKEFGMNKLDIQRVSSEIITKVHAVLLGAQNNGFRHFFMSTHQSSEVSSKTSDSSGRGAVIPQIKSLFGMGANER